ncbi:hypothetical protein CDL12_23742 [Handroanthus impetiginosus]|uniref:Uncharacterized protein n=1 Tax=Handroanthus impetiginosus TaxID=429701 RepID=A0A2G9GEL8_9LAMI|nr:hypothetical protein CDL12_23742 [Handroanthus impetiginosus]
MEIPATLYFSCCSLITVTFLVIGFNSLDNQKHEFSPLLVLLLKQFLAISVCHSSSYALIHRPGANTSLVNHFKVSILGFSLPLYVHIVSGHVPLIHLLSYAVLAICFFFFFTTPSSIGFYVDFLIRFVVFSFSFRAQRDKFFPIVVLVASFFTAAIAAIFDGLSSDPKDFKTSKKVKLGASILASIIFQILVKFTSFSHVVAFLCFCVVWLGCLAMVMPLSDLGVFDFLLHNVLIGCVNAFGLYGPTFFAYCASVVLFVLHSKLETVQLVHDQDIVLW